jgi:acyl dehydratase
MKGAAVGRYYEDLQVGDEFLTPGRTITEADVTIYAGFSGDYNPLHTDEEFARTTIFGRRILHGPAAFCMATGLVARLGLVDGTAIAFLGMTWELKAPIFIGDTIHVRERVVEKRLTRKPGRGIVTFEVEVVNQRGEVVQAGRWNLMLATRDANAQGGRE